MDCANLQVKEIGSIRLVRIDREDTFNKLSIPCMNGIVALLHEYADDPGCRSVILAGGKEFFCSGGELGDFRKKTTMDIKTFGAAFIGLHTAMQQFPKPIIAAVEGNAFGGGFSLVEACDLAIGAQNALFAVPEILDGLAPAMGLSGLFANLPKKEIMSLGLLGTKLTAQQTLQCGLLNEVVPQAEVMGKALELATFFENKSPTAVRLFKELYADMGFAAYERRLRLGQSMMVALFKSNDGMEALSGKEEDRAPQWKGN